MLHLKLLQLDRELDFKPLELELVDVRLVLELRGYEDAICLGQQLGRVYLLRFAVHTMVHTGTAQC